MSRLFFAFTPIVFFGCGIVQEFGSPDPKGRGSSNDPGLAAVDGGIPDVATISWLNPTPTGNDLRGIWGTADDDIWVAGSHGTVVHWDGKTASLAYDGNGALDLYAIWGSSKDDVWIAGRSGASGQALHWDGKAWSSAYTIGQHSIHALWGTSPNDVWALAEAGSTFHFDGTAFQHVPFCGCDDGPPPPVLRDLWGSSATDVWAVGERGAIVRRDAIGFWQLETRWQPGMANPFAAENAYRGIWGSSANDVWAVFVDAGPGRTARKVGFSHFDGSAWRVVQLEEGGLFEASAEPTRRGHRVWGSSANDIMALVDSTNWRWNGTKWQTDPFGPPSGRWLAAWGSPGHGIMAVGERGAWGRRSGGQDWQQFIPGLRERLSSVSVAPDGSVWAITQPIVPGPMGNGLVSWTSSGWAGMPPLPVARPRTAVLASITALSKDDVWIAGTDGDGDGTSPNQDYGFVARFTNGAWRPLQRVPMKRVSDLAVRDATDAWVVGAHGAARWNGTAWTEVPVGAASTVPVGVTIAGTNDVWVLGLADEPNGQAGGSVLHWDGAALREVHRSARIVGGRIWASGPNDVWVSGRPGMHFDGSTWSPIGATDYKTNAFWGTGPKDVWMLSSSTGEGRIHHWDGSTISTQLEVSPGLNALSGRHAHDVWFVGDSGATLHYATSAWKPPR